VRDILEGALVSVAIGRPRPSVELDSLTPSLQLFVSDIGCERACHIEAMGPRPAARRRIAIWESREIGIFLNQPQKYG
jgi:hypothetical protein